MPGPTLAAHLLAAALAAGPLAAAPSTVLVTGGDRFGAGIVWDAPAGLVLTALHVVEGVAAVQVSLDGAPPAAARVVDVEPALDLALLAAGPLAPAAAARASAGAASGDRVRLLGFPRLRAAEVAGTVVDPARRFAGARYVEIAGVVEPGASGGPVVDGTGAVVGLVDLVLAGRGVTLAIPIDAAAARFPRPAPGAAAPAASLAREAPRAPASAHPGPLPARAGRG